ncbi:MAG: indolepyruvate oxidoreductase subunit beta family protein [Rhodospirillaceae bacterium]|nr:indolepyruvate oxidoreductase subunit beta family protein [Rhodospirillaceae bacterium]
MSAPEVIKLAILAVGGQGGGVLTGWLVGLAEANGWRVQSTVVAGVAQRTGATIYYLEMAPAGEREPVFALSPAAGDVDILVAAELMEAGRAVMRGFVTPDRTTLIASTHRTHAVSEKIVPGDGQAPEEEVFAAMETAAKRLITADYQQAAVDAGSVISASLFGALAAADVLPFPRASFADVIKASGRGVDASLRAFEAGAAGDIPAAEEPARREAAPRGPARLMARWTALEARLEDLPAPVREMAATGLRHVVDFQDPAYGAEYLDRLERAVAADGGDHAFSIAVAKYIANAMAYDDVIRVADLKTRRSRFDRVRREMGLDAGDVAPITEFMRPRVQELCGAMPAWLGAWIETRPGLARWIDRRVNKGRRVRTDGIFWFGALYLLAGAKRWRRGMLRHRVETAHLERWFALALETAQRDRALAAEIVACRRLIKGYSDTHARGEAKFDRVLAVLPMLEGRADAADWLRRLRDAALRDEKGEALEGALKTVASFATKQAA